MRVLFLCTGNSCRSQMAEGWLRHLAGAQVEALSAGTKPVGVNPTAIAVMREIGIDISDHHSNHISEFASLPLDYLITVCDHAKETCPVAPNAARVLHWSFEDPAGQPIQQFRRVRDEIGAKLREFVTAWPGKP